ncbi:MAG: peptidoglycan-binding protein [bacterium]|nr:peptidoglycan-binding protein [bacterium]
MGAKGGAVRDLHRKLTAAGAACLGPPELYTADTAEAVERFQQSRGLPADGVCGPATWAALVEAGHRLGDRLLYLRTPYVRGEDVAELQRRLGALGFSAGRVDGILGPKTASAIGAFQENAGLTADRICGPDTVAVLGRIPADDSHSMEMLLERERLRSRPRLLSDAPIALVGGDSLVVATARLLRRSGATVIVLAERDGSAAAAVANELDTSVLLDVRLADGPSCDAFYFATAGFTSSGGKRLAELLARELGDALELPASAPVGMRLPLLRESRMPAVECRLGPPPLVVERQAALAGRIAQCLADWIAEPL